jgi:type II secretory pathway component PulK
MLVIALGVLALLSVLAVTFVSLMKLELLASKNYVDGVKARLIAEGGMEEATAELKTIGGLTAVSNINDSWIYANGNYSLPLEQATPRNGQILSGASLLTRTSYDGDLGGSYAAQGDCYRIEVIDAQCQFNLNNVFDGQTLDPTMRETNVYTRELRCLGEAIRQLDPLAQGVDPIARAAYPRNAPKYFGADAFFAYKQTLEGKQFSSKDQLNDILASPQDYINLRTYVTTKSWLDPKTVIANNHDLGSMRVINNVNTFISKQPWTDVLAPVPITPTNLPYQRAPINVNLATPAVLAANLAGLSGRATFFYYGNRSATNMLEAVDAQTKYSFSGSGGTNVQEELQYSVSPVNVYFDPMGYKPGSAGATGATSAVPPPIIDGALAIAHLIDLRRRSGQATATTTVPTASTTGPFKSFADWERWVDANLSDSFFQNTKNKDGTNAFPQPSTVKILNIDDSPLLGTPSPGDILNSPRFKPWFYDCLRSVIKANMNPNGRMSMLNPNAAIALNVDKGNLLYFTTPVQPTVAKFNSQTCEWCFGSKGVFEIISLGEVLGRLTAGAVAGASANPQVGTYLDTANPIAEAKILTDIQLFNQVTHTSQRDFERSGDPVSFSRPFSSSGTGGGYGGFGDELGQLPPGNAQRYGIISYPYPKQFWDPRVGGWPNAASPSQQTRDIALMTGGPQAGWHAHDEDGHIELSPRMTIKGRPNDTTTVNFGNELFQLLFQDRHVRTPGILTTQVPADSFMADTSNKLDQWTNPGFGCPSEGDPTIAYAFPQPVRPVNAVQSLPGAPTAYDPSAASGLYDGVDERQLYYIYNLFMESDGFYTNELRNLPLYYRASDKNNNVNKSGSSAIGWPPGFTQPTNPNLTQGESIPNNTTLPAGVSQFNGGNCMATPTGGVEFWYKPDFDWFVRQKNFNSSQPGMAPDPTVGFAPGTVNGNLPDERFCGLIVSCHNVTNANATHWSTTSGVTRATRGIEMNVIRDTSGDLRVVRIYFEVCGEAGSDLPWVSDIQPGKGGPLLTGPGIRNGRVGVKGSYMDNATTQPQYTWPPYEFQTIPQPWHDIKYARVDTWVPAIQLTQWRAHEWHDIGVRWDDRAGIGPAHTDSIEIYLDGVEAQTVSRQIGPSYGAIINTPQQPIAPPTPPATTLTNPPTQPEPAFCRLNEDPSGNNPSVGLWPRDHIQIGGLTRQQAVVGGLFKFTQALTLPANGTVDKVRFYDGITVKANGYADRYEEFGIWTNDFDVSGCFAPGNAFLDLGNLQFTAYLPTYFANATPAAGRGGAGSVEVSFSIIHQDKSVTTYQPGANFLGWSLDFRDNSGPAGFQLTDPTNRPAVVTTTDRLVYTVKIYPARLQGGSLGGDASDSNGFAVATPALDDISLVYFLPTAQVLLKERLWD